MHEAVGINPQNAKAHYSLGVALQEQAGLDPSIDAFNKAVNYVAAIGEFKKAFDIDPTIPTYEDALKTALLVQSDLQLAGGSPETATMGQEPGEPRPTRSP